MSFPVPLLLLLLFSGLCPTLSAIVVSIKSVTTIAKTDDNFVCATMDWWPPDKCNYGICPWGNSSILNLDLNNPILVNALKGRHSFSSKRFFFFCFLVYPLGNELSGSGVSASVEAVQYGKDMIVLKNVINDLYGQSKQHPKLLAPGGFFDEKWFADMLQTSGPGVIDAATHHIYNLGPGESSHPSHCSKLMF
ncbi:hypothetical protein BHE74_00016841 [Ensete ventricosum]|nr:hypothetical protein BHE74_00016841 [Ensete ventricosum]